jgi:hypothetical protein
MIKTLVFNAKLPVLLGASPFYLIPRSPIARHFDEPTETDIFKARLTAMAIETQEFAREDLYTLLITTRILNFLKGIPLRSPRTSLKQALAIAAKRDPRSACGVEALKRLLAGKVLFASTSRGREPLPRFRAELFFALWQKLDTIQTQENRTIRIRGG